MDCSVLRSQIQMLTRKLAFVPEAPCACSAEPVMCQHSTFNKAQNSFFSYNLMLHNQQFTNILLYSSRENCGLKQLNYSELVRTGGTKHNSSQVQTLLVNMYQYVLT
jgi:hypothetical protein